VREVSQKQARYLTRLAQAGGMAHHLLCWTDIPVVDLDRAICFYSALLDCHVTKQAHEGFEMGVLPHRGNEPAACLSPSTENEPSQTGPLVYLSVDGRLDDAVQKAGCNGGRVLEPKRQIGPYGYRALILDSEGNRVALHSVTA
jgi:predicted enzyme related to lactoylglutathione lyase